MPPAMLADVLRLARQLSPLEKLQLIERMVPEVEAVLISASVSPPRRRGLRGLLRGCNISAPDIDQARREQWDEFPRGDI